MIFLTGGTGFLGRELLLRLLNEGGRVALLVRPNSRFDVRSRILNLLDELFGHGQAHHHLPKLEFYQGDVTLENFGLAPSEFRKLAERVTTIYHTAASTSLGQGLEEARSINVGGTAQVLKLAEQARTAGANPVRFCHVSTAYVAGDRENVVQSSDLQLNHTFRNAYEQSKAEAEQLVRDNAGRVSTFIVRPSVIVGDSHTGKTSTFNVIYIPARLMAQGLFWILPAHPNIPCDLVPVNYVADAMVALAKKQHQSGACFHLCAGVGRETSPKEILEMVVNTVNEYRKKGKTLLAMPPMIPLEMILRVCSTVVTTPSFRHFEEVVMKRLGLLAQLLPFFPYMNRNPRFDISDTTLALQGILQPPPLFCEYAERVFRYCLETNWGRKAQVDFA